MPENQPRRLAAILAADIAGYSALIGANEARTVRDLKRHQAVALPVCARRGLQNNCPQPEPAFVAA